MTLYAVLTTVTIVAVAVIFLLLLALPVSADGPGPSAFDPPPPHTHAPGEDWIMRGGHRNAAGEWCCGEGDCLMVRGVATVTRPAAGYRLPGGEFVPQSEAQPSPDGQFWRCKRPDGTRRCFFAPPPQT